MPVAPVTNIRYELSPHWLLLVLLPGLEVDPGAQTVKLELDSNKGELSGKKANINSHLRSLGLEN